MREIVVDLFAGGGGASEGIEKILGIPVDVAINHDPVAIAIHKMNHPETEHWTQDAWKVPPKHATRTGLSRVAPMAAYGLDPESVL